MNLKQTATNKYKILLTLFYVLAITVQLLVVFKIIPYTWVNGGMSDSYQAQAVQSVLSAAIIAGLYVFVSRVIKRVRAPKKWDRKLLYALITFWALGFCMQLLGTPFEKIVLAPLLLLGVLSHAILLTKLRSVHSRDT